MHTCGMHGMSVAMALAEANHLNAPRRQKAPPRGMRPASLAEPQGLQVVFERHVVEQVHDAPVVPILAAPVPHTVDHLDVLKILGIQLLLLPEQVTEVPTISTPSRCSRIVLSAPQMAEQLVEVPTVLSYALLQRLGVGRSLPGFLPEQSLTASVAAPGQRSAEHNIDIPVPRRGESGFLQGFSPGHGSGQRSAEQNADIPIPRRGAREGLQGFPPGQSFTVSVLWRRTMITPVPRLSSQSWFSPKTVLQRTVEQIIDIPVSRTRKCWRSSWFSPSTEFHSPSGGAAVSWRRVD